MPDVMSKEQRSNLMGRVRGRDTAPERLVRSLLHRAGLRFRKNVTGLPGRPDIVLTRHRTIVFVHGCFWHRHSGCTLAKLPGTNVSFWSKKLADNAERDKRNAIALRRLGWHVITVWDCRLRRSPQAELRRIVNSIRRQAE
jgi:DNA mismatch endonuclease (patch repair protein)